MQQIRLIDPVEVGRQGGIKRAERLTTQERREIASAAAKARWHRQEYQTATQLEQAEQEAEEALKAIRAQGDLTSIVRVVEAESGDVVYATTRREPDRGDLA